MVPQRFWPLCSSSLCPYVTIRRIRLGSGICSQVPSSARIPPCRMTVPSSTIVGQQRLPLSSVATPIKTRSCVKPRSTTWIPCWPNMSLSLSSLLARAAGNENASLTTSPRPRCTTRSRYWPGGGASKRNRPAASVTVRATLRPASSRRSTNTPLCPLFVPGTRTIPWRPPSSSGCASNSSTNGVDSGASRLTRSGITRPTAGDAAPKNTALSPSKTSSTRPPSSRIATTLYPWTPAALTSGTRAHVSSTTGMRMVHSRMIHAPFGIL